MQNMVRQAAGRLEKISLYIVPRYDRNMQLHTLIKVETIIIFRSHILAKYFCELKHRRKVCFSTGIRTILVLY